MERQAQHASSSSLHSRNSASVHSGSIHKEASSGMLEAKALRSKVEMMWEGAKIVDLEKEKLLPRFTMAEVAKGPFLGKGGFCTVDQIRRFTEDPESSSPSTDEDVEFEDRDFIVSHCRRSNGHARYAIKYLSPEVLKDKPRFLQGLADFAAETHFLTSLDHPNIVKLRAVADGSPFSKSYFLVLDRLYDILDTKLPKWAKQKKKLLGAKAKKALLKERLVAAADLADAVDFLHNHNIIYRDIKAENIGFNFHGQITLFDFGLPKELDDKDRHADGNWKLSGHTGTLRYMAPEVYKSVPYNYSCDAYSFAVLLWEMMALERAYSGYSLKKHTQDVLLGGKRPPIKDKWPQIVRELLEMGFDEDTEERPGMGDYVHYLRQEIEDMQG